MPVTQNLPLLNLDSNSQHTTLTRVIPYGKLHNIVITNPEASCFFLAEIVS